jgi:hypothetical protein
MAKGNADEAADLLLNPTPDLMAKASDVSEYRLFRQDPGAVMGAYMNLRNKAPVLRFVTPFITTPTNLLKYGLERSPAGWLNPNLWKNLASKSPEAADQIARAGIGSMLAAGIAMYAADGKITGAPPVNAAERDRFYREGKQPYALKIGDQWVSYQRLEPLNQAFSQVASVVNAVQAGDDKGAAEIAMQAGADIGKNLLSQTFVTGLNDAINAIDDPGRYAEQFAGRMASSMVPFSALTRTVAQATDPTIRQPENIPERIASNLPVLSQTVPARLTAFGEPSQREVGAINPYTHSQEKTDPLTQELNRLQYNTGFVGDSISNVPLNRAQQRQYQELAGQLTKRLFERLMQKDAYQQLDDSQRIEVLDKLTAEARKIARDTVLDQMIEGRLQERDAAGVR